MTATDRAKRQLFGFLLSGKKSRNAATRKLQNYDKDIRLEVITYFKENGLIAIEQGEVVKSGRPVKYIYLTDKGRKIALKQGSILPLTVWE